MKPDARRQCESCGASALRRKLIEDEPGRHEYLMMCEACGHEHAAWIELHYSAVPAPKLNLPAADRFWLCRVAAIAGLPAGALAALALKVILER
jgi:hypothetical protein